MNLTRLLVASSLLLGACVRSLPLESLPCPCSEGWSCCDNGNVCVREGATCPSFEITPPAPKVSVGHSLQLSSSEPVTWQVERGSVDDGGLYWAPDEPGSYHLTAISRATPKLQLSATIEVVPLTVALVAGQPGGRGFTDGVGAEARLSLVFDLADDGAGTLYVADALNQAIRAVDVATGKLTTIAGAPDPFRLYNGWTAKDGTLAQATFYEPAHLALAGPSLYVHDRLALRKIDLVHGTVSTIIGGLSWNDPAALHDSYGPLLFDGGHFLYFFWDYYNNGYSEIRRVDVETSEVTSVAGTRTGKSADGVGAAATFSALESFLVLPSGSFLLCDHAIDGPLLRKLDPATATVTTYPFQIDDCQVMARAGDDVCFYDSTRYRCATEANLDEVNPFLTSGGILDPPFQSIGFGEKGRFFGGRDAVVVQSLSIAPPYSPLVGAEASYGANDGSGGAARFFGPMGVALDENEQNLFVADSVNSTLRRIDLGTGWVSTLAGVAGFGDDVDGLAQNARFDRPSDLCYVNGTLYVGEQKSIRAVDAVSGQTRTLVTLPDDHSLMQFSCDSTHLYAVSEIQTTVNGIGHPLTGAEQINLATGERVSLLVQEPSTIPMVAAARSGRVPYLVYRSPTSATMIVDEIYPATGALHQQLESEELFQSLATVWGQAGPGRAALDTRGRIYFAVGSTLSLLDPASGQVTSVLGDWQHQGLVLGPQPAGLNTTQGLAVSRSGDLFVADSTENAVVVAR